MMKTMLLAALAACATSSPNPPDAGDGHYEGDGHDHIRKPYLRPDASADAELDASPEPCWQTRYYQCGDEIYQVCVPYNGCSDPFQCQGNPMQYCGPGAF